MAGHDPSRLLASFLEHYDDLLRFLVRRVGTVERAADVAQDTYLRLAGISDGTGAIVDPRAYVFRVAGNIAIDTLRRDGRIQSRTSGEDAALDVPDPAPLGDAVLAGRERLRLLDAALAALPPKAAKALLLSRVEGLTHARIAARLGVSESMVGKYLVQALRHCRDWMARAEAEK